MDSLIVDHDNFEKEKKKLINRENSSKDQSVSEISISTHHSINPRLKGTTS